MAVLHWEACRERHYIGAALVVCVLPACLTGMGRRTSLSASVSASVEKCQGCAAVCEREGAGVDWERRFAAAAAAAVVLV